MKFIEERFGLPTLTNRDAQASDTLDSFDFNQSPIPPLILTDRVCSPASTTALTFPPQQVNTPSALYTVTLLNYNSTVLNISNIAIAGSDFTQTNTCSGGVPPPQGHPNNCVISVSFNPQSTGTRTGTMTITDNDVTSPQVVSLSGTGTQVILSPSLLNFGVVTVGGTTTALTATLTNHASTSLSISSITASGDYAQTNGCGSSLPAGGSCNINVTFTPTSVGTRFGQVTVVDGDQGSPHVLNLTGVGTMVSVSPTSLIFGTQAMGTTSLPQTITLTNLGVATLNITGITVFGQNGGQPNTASPDFAQTNTCGSSLSGGASCTVSVTFSPAALGSRLGSVDIFDAESDSPQIISLSGTGSAAQVNAVPSITLPLSPSTLTPGSGKHPLTVNGANFAKGATVNWDGVALATTFVSNHRLMATIPAPNLGTAMTAAVTVVNPAPGGGTSNVALFHVTNALSSLAYGSKDTPSGTMPFAIAAGDFDGNGKTDLAVVNSGSNNVSIYLGAGDGTFTLKSQPGVGAGPDCIAVGDFNSDGKLDLAVGNLADNTVSILLGNGDGTFQLTSSPSAVSPAALAVGDFNRDSRLDLAVASSVDNTVSILNGTGNGNFVLFSTPPAVGLLPKAIYAGDVTGDGKLDLIEASSGSNELSVLPGNGDGTFGFGSSPNTGDSPIALAVGDFNGDAQPDLAVANQSDNTISILLGGGGGFTLFGTLNTGSSPSALALDDFNGDGKVDIAVTNAASNTVSIFTGNGDGTFNAGATFPTGTTPTALAVGDFNGDGNLDLATANSGAGTFSLLTESSSGAPGITISPSSLTFGTQLIGTTSASQTVTITNTGTATLVLTRIATTGDFLKTNQCPTSLAVGASCQVLVSFSPRGKGVRSGTLSVTDNAPGSPQSIPLTGTGTVVSLSSTALNFGNQAVGTTSTPQTVTITNNAVVTLTLNGGNITGANAGDFAMTTTCGSSLAPGASCMFSVTFTPTATGSRSAMLNISDNGGGSPQIVALSGNGI